MCADVEAESGESQPIRADGLASCAPALAARVTRPPVVVATNVRRLIIESSPGPRPTQLDCGLKIAHVAVA